jgi:acetylornithine deacetylase
MVAFEAHMDTVVLSGEAQAKATVRGHRLHGRGACDTKGALVAMLEALRILQGRAHATILFAATIDEEFGATGVRRLVQGDHGIDLAVVGEPTQLQTAIAHKGLLRFRIRTEGRAAHGSRPELGVNAIYGMGPVLDVLQQEVIPGLGRLRHPLLGSPSLAVTTIRGGAAENIIPDTCIIGIDRRVNPGEDVQGWLGELDRALESTGRSGVEIVREDPWFQIAPLDTPADHPLTRAMQEARHAVLGLDDSPIGVTYGSDASALVEAGVPTIVFGPGSIAQAHGDDEWVEIDDVARAAEILAELAVRLGYRDRSR